MRYFKIVVIAAIVLMQQTWVFGQAEGCGASLQKAQNLYNQGMIDEIADILKPCLENGFTRNQRNEAYKLIILASLLDGNQQQAESTMIEFLKKNPEYEVMANDPVEFVYLFETYRTLSVFSVGLKFGPNLSNPRVLVPYTAGDMSTTTLSNKSGAGYQIGLAVNRYLAKHLFVNLEFSYFLNSYKFIDEYRKYSLPDEPQTEKIVFNESVNRFDIPLSLGYEFESGTFNYYIRAGASYSRLFSANGTPSGEYSLENNTETGVKRSLDTHRNESLYFCHVGAGIKYKVPRGYLVADIRYHFGLNNIVNTDNRYGIGQLLKDYYHIDDDFTVNTLSLSFGYYFSFYQPRKRL